MATGTNQYNPDYAVPPGWLLEEYLEVRGMSQAEFARMCGHSPKTISELISGKAPLNPKMAIAFERVLGLGADIWLGIESNYRLRKTRQADAKNAAASAKWAKDFPIRDLVQRGYFQHPKSDADAVAKLLAFFRVGSVDAWVERQGLANAAYRHSPSFKSDAAALATWLRLGEIEAERQDCAEYGKTRFKRAVREIRSLTREPVGEALKKTATLCNKAGVALALVPPLPRTALSGAAWWLSPRTAVIQLSARHKSDDHLWFSFFHEAAHILLHSKKGVFVDGTDKNDAGIEAEANAWAENALVPRPDWERFAARAPRSRQAVQAFADEQGISAGIIVGMLQHQRVLPWTRLNDLKVGLDPDALGEVLNDVGGGGGF